MEIVEYHFQEWHNVLLTDIELLLLIFALTCIEYSLCKRTQFFYIAHYHIHQVLVSAIELLIREEFDKWSIHHAQWSTELMRDICNETHELAIHRLSLFEQSISFLTQSPANEMTEAYI